MGMIRVQIRKDGSIALPKNVRDALDVGPGSYLKITIEDGRAALEKVAYDPWAEGQKKPEHDSFDKILEQQEKGLQNAEKDFLEKLKNPPEIRPEDRRDFWD